MFVIFQNCCKLTRGERQGTIFKIQLNLDSIVLSEKKEKGKKVL